ncbi:MAG: T9SS type A sorting domain-containing protein, partial [Candidatus Eisenbacteria sp.]|nr:T9SS type A sorting domain-containing protein [Candidatus Eisenbacteria bacterium]
VDWARLQWPHTIDDYAGAIYTVYGRLSISGVTEQTTGNDPIPGVILADVGYGPSGSDPSSDPSWTWINAVPNPAWDGAAAGEPYNDEYMADLVVPSTPGTYDYCYRFSGNKGYDWTYADIDDTDNGYQTENAGKMTVLDEDVCCSAPDNGTGTIDFPPDCPYDHPTNPMKIIDGLPPGTTIELWGPLADFYNVVNVPGGILGGEICTFDASLQWSATGTGDLTGFNRQLWMPVTGEIHIGPRNPGDPVQLFDADLIRLEGELFGDPDFCTLRIRGGTDFGLPSPGQTILTELPSGDFAVDSFFDITYEIEFEGCPGSQLDGYAGITTDTVRKLTCHDTTYSVDWCRLQWPHTIEDYPGSQVTIYGRVYIAGLTDQTPGNDTVPGMVIAQWGFGPGSDPFEEPAGWHWTDAIPNPGWDAIAAGEPDNDEYMAAVTLPNLPGDYDYCFRFSGDGGLVWVYGDKDTGVPGEDGSENGYQTENAGKMTIWETCCLAPDNGTGTIDFPPDCPFDHPNDPMMIIDGLPPGDTIELDGPLTNFINVHNTPGGILGGEVCTFDAQIEWVVTGTGNLQGFSRHLWMPVTGEIHIGPRNPGDPVQIFDADLYRLQGELFGDPDFCTLRILGGSDFGLPGPGHATLTQLPSGDFAVDSFFDITYQIEFEGCPGSQLDGYAGITTDTVLRLTCHQPRTVDWGRLQWPLTIEDYPGTQVTVYGRVYVPGLTDQTPGVDPLPGLVLGQAGFGPGSDPFEQPAAWTWTDAVPNPAWDGIAAGEPDNDEYMATVTLPLAAGDYDYCYRFSGDGGTTWLYVDKDTGVPGEDGSENGYQTENAGKMTVYEVCCIEPDNGTGTIDFPAQCPYDNLDEPMMIIDGLPPATTIEMHGPLTNFSNVHNTPGGMLGGEVCTFDAMLQWDAIGTGAMTGFTRSLWVPVTGEIHIAPRNLGDPVQIFDAELYRLQGELFGDPDFCTLRILGGADFGLPGPGQTTLTQLPSGDFAVDSFFDITYQIEFEGCPGSQLDGMAGTTTHTVRRTTCWMLTGIEEEAPAPEKPTRLLLAPVSPNPFAVSTQISYSIPAGAARSSVTLSIYDVTGRRVRQLVDRDQVPGVYHVLWDGRDRNGTPVASGIYFCWLRTGGETTSRRMVLLR